MPTPFEVRWTEAEVETESAPIPIAHAELLKPFYEALARVRTKLDADYVAELERAMAEVRTRCEAAARDPRSVVADDFHRAKQALDVLSMRVHESAIAETLRRE